MTAVERVRVGDVLSLERREVTIDPQVEYRLVGVYSFGKGIFHRYPKAGAELGDYRFFRIEPGDLVLSNIQAWEGAVGFATEVERGTVGTHRFLSYVAASDQIDTNWARWFFLSEPGMTLIRRAAPGTAVRNRTLAVKRFEDLVIPLPPIEQQLRAAMHLDALGEQARSIEGSLAGPDSGTLKTALPPLVDVVVARSTSGYGLLGQLAELVADTVHPGDSFGEAETFVGLQHIERHTGRRVGADEIDAMKGRKFRFMPGDVVYGYLRPYLNKVWAADRHGLCSVDQYVLRPKPTVNPELLAHILRGQSVLDRAIELTHSLQLPRLRSGLLTSLEIPLVAERDTVELVKRLELLRDRIVAVAAYRERQMKATAALVPAALNEVFGGHRGSPT